MLGLADEAAARAPAGDDGEPPGRQQQRRTAAVGSRMRERNGAAEMAADYPGDTGNLPLLNSDPDPDLDLSEPKPPPLPSRSPLKFNATGRARGAKAPEPSSPVARLAASEQHQQKSNQQQQQQQQTQQLQSTPLPTDKSRPLLAAEMGQQLERPASAGARPSVPPTTKSQQQLGAAAAAADNNGRPASAMGAPSRTRSAGRKSARRATPSELKMKASRAAPKLAGGSAASQQITVVPSSDRPHRLFDTQSVVQPAQSQFPNGSERAQSSDPSLPQQHQLAAALGSGALAPQRPHSALGASGLSSSGSGRLSSSNWAANGTNGAKITRVRINSTSEQIQDPNWLTQMSEQPKKCNHLKALHRKLKSTISGAVQVPSLVGQSRQDSASSAAGSSAPPPLVPRTPVKVPVSILKQPGGSQEAARKSPVPPAHRNVSLISDRVHPSALKSSQPQQQLTKPANVGQQASSNHKVSSRRPSPQLAPSESAVQTPQLGAFSIPPSSPHREAGCPAPSETADSTGSPVPRLAPICAGGSIRVSGWKRNNLLAKTLSHLDEIRGNQRPVFVPTKLKVPGNEVAAPASTSAAALPAKPLAQSSAIPGRKSSKFADIVREAVSKKNLLQAASNPAHPSSSDSAPSAKLPGSPIQAKRGSDGEPKVLRCTQSSCEQQQQRQTSGQCDSQQVPSERSSSASLLSNTPSQLIGGKLDSTQPSPVKQMGAKQGSPQSGGGRKQSPLISHGLPIAQQVSQLLENATGSSASCSASSRLFKLQHKNNQVLRKLSANQQDQLEASAEAANQQSGESGSVHLKDWKRLKSKLTLLTSPKHFATGAGSVQPAKAHPGGGGAGRTGLLRVSAGPELDSERQLVGRSSNNGLNNVPVRLTVSNQESRINTAAATAAAQSDPSKLGDRRAGSQQQVPHQQALQVPLNRSAPDASDINPERKWSSSSMAGCDSAALLAGKREPFSSRSAAVSPMLSTVGIELAASTNYRRRSDSEAYKTSTDMSSNASAPPPDAPISHREPVVVHRNDLLQLLQVKSSGNSLNGNCGPIVVAGKQRSSLHKRHSLQSNQESEKQQQGAANKSRRQVNYRRRSSLLSGSFESLFQQRGRARDALGDSQVDLDGAELAPIDSAAQVDNNGLGSGAQSKGSIGGHTKGKSDLSWVVRKTSKVAFFQRKLRKMRWHSKQQRNKQLADSPGLDGTQAELDGKPEQEVEGNPADAASLKQSQLHSSSSSTVAASSGAEVFMDPTLIGDAIEIFLRSTMQQSNCASGSGAADTTLADYGNEKSRESFSLQPTGSGGFVETSIGLFGAGDSNAIENEDRPAEDGFAAR